MSVNTMESLEFYLKNAQNAIRKFGNLRMSLDEDAVAYVANYMMRADQKYDGKTGTREGYRWRWAKYAVMNFSRTYKKKYNTISIDSINNNDCKMSDNLTLDKIPKNNNNLYISDIIETIREADYLTDREKSCLFGKYVDDKTLQEIGDNIGTTRERVRQVIEKAIYKIRANT